MGGRKGKKQNLCSRSKKRGRDAVMRDTFVVALQKRRRCDGEKNWLEVKKNVVEKKTLKRAEPSCVTGTASLLGDTLLRAPEGEEEMDPLRKLKEP